MPLTIPPEVKKITPFVRRAEEMDKDAVNNPESRLVAYYLRQYAVQQGIPLASTSAPAKACLGEILGSLEREKAAMDNFTKDEAAFLCRQFATKIFQKADAEDRAGQASKATARTFYAAATFLQILDQFGADETGEDKKKIVYAKWKATDIINAFKEGRSPTPGGYGEQEPDMEDEEDDENEKVDATTSSFPPAAPMVAPVSDNDADEEIIMPPPPPQTIPSPRPPAIPPPYVPPRVPDAPSSGPPQRHDSEEEGTEVDLEGNSLPPPPSYPGPSSTTASRIRPPVTFDLPPVPVPPPPVAPSGTGWFGSGRNNNNSNNNSKARLTKAQWDDAMELTRFALAALEDKNAAMAAERLQQALQTLGR